MLLLAVCTSVANADIYGYADADGAVYLTDSPAQVSSPEPVATYGQVGTPAQPVTPAQLKALAQAAAPMQQAYELLAISPVEPVSIASASAAAMDAVELDDKAPISAKGLLYKEQVKVAALDNGVETALLHAVIMTESNYNARAISPKGARGLMQLMPFTAKRFGVNNSYDPSQNIQGGARYLSYLLKLFKNDFSLAVAAYNAGENAIIEHGNKIPPYRETVHYVSKVMSIYKKLRAA